MKMKQLLLATSALIVAGSAHAADLGARPYTKAPMAAPVPFSWTGCYVGGHVGGGAHRTSFTETGVSTGFPGGGISTIAPLPGDSIGLNGDVGVVGGVQAGCDYQFSNNWVIGIAGDFAGTDIHGVVNDPFFGGKAGNPATLSSRTDWVASVTGRVGYTWDRFLVYAKGGAGFAHDRYSLDNFVFLGGPACGVFPAFTACSASTSTDRIGWTAGVGFEWAFAPNWSALVEYNHYGFDTKRVAFFNPAGPTSALIDIRQDLDIVKVGINYRFGGAGVVAKY